MSTRTCSLTWETPQPVRWTLLSDSLGGVKVVSESPGAKLGLVLFSAICRAFISAPGRIRTSDSRFRKPLLYPLSYRRVGSTVYLTKGKPSISLIRCFGFWDEVVVEQGREHAARYRADYADPDGVEMSGHERRSQGSHGFAEPPVTGPALSTPQARAKPTARGPHPLGPSRRWLPR